MISLGISSWIQKERLERAEAIERMNFEVDRIRRQHWQANTLMFLGYNMKDVDFWQYLDRFYMAGLSPRSASFELAEVMRIYRGGR